MHILVPLDGSPLAELALITAAETAQRLPMPTTITLLRVIDYPAADLRLEALNPLASGPIIIEAVLEAAHDYLRAVSRLPSLAECVVQQVVMVGTPASTIIEQAQVHSADLIIMTTHGRTGVLFRALGGIVEGVLRHTTVPVLLVREHHTALTPTHHALQILVPVDASELAERAIMAAVPLARALGGKLLLLRVLPPEPHPIKRDLAQHHARTQLAQWDAALAQQHVPVQHIVLFGEVQAQIAAAAQAHHATLIAIATHGRTGVDRLLHGSITETLTHHTMLPILVVHAVESASLAK
ncbi:MAG: universal stress protein [Ktedonobacterales bacterium]|nr:universal stress protein [Ktedonobacterales bacterium]